MKKDVIKRLLLQGIVIASAGVKRCELTAVLSQLWVYVEDFIHWWPIDRQIVLNGVQRSVQGVMEFVPAFLHGRQNPLPIIFPITDLSNKSELVQNRRGS